jgi:hypothetical protein
MGQWARARQLAVGSLLGVVLAGLILAWAGRRTVRPSEALLAAPLLPESTGGLSEVVMHYVPRFNDLVEPTYSDFLRAIGADVRVEFVVPQGLEANDSRKLDELLGRIDPSGALAKRCSRIESQGPITTWSKDRALVTAAPSPGEPALLVAPSEPSQQWVERHNDWLTVQSLARGSAGRYKATIAPLDFDAGDFIVDNERVIVDTNLLDKNRHRGINDVRELHRRLVAWLQAPVIVLGQEPGDTPRHHIAMYLTPLQRNVVLVGDPSAARSIVGEGFAPGDPSGDTGEPLRADFSDVMIGRFERAARELTALGYRVERIPNVPFDDKTYLSYTNGVFETRDGKNIAYVPAYGMAALDEAARAVYTRLGWEVRSIRVRAVYPFHGTVGCLVNVLARKR